MKVCNFFSRFWNSGCSSVDFFVQNLDGENCLVVAPLKLIASDSLFAYFQDYAPIIVPFGRSLISGHYL